jgi:hypothetical protein
MSTDLTSRAQLIWTNPAAVEEQPTLIHLTTDALLLAVIPRKDLDAATDTLRKGGSVAGRSIPLSAVTRLDGVEEESDLDVTHKQGESKTEKVTVTLPDHTQRDELLTALGAALGPEWLEERRPKNRFVAALWPVGVLVGVVLLTLWMYEAAQALAAGRQLQLPRHGKARLMLQIMHWIEGMIGATGVLILGGILGVLCFWWLFAAVANPPVQIRVTKRGDV